MGAIHKLIDVLEDSLKKLNSTASSHDVETLAALVSNVMSWQSRQFHTLDHVFGFVEAADPIIVLTAVFHDLIYYQVDHGFPGEMGALFEDCLDRRDGKIFLRDHRREPDCPIDLSRRIFGFVPGQELTPFTGLNEFLSAVVMNRLLENFLSLKFRIFVTVCIEASIPFRGLDGEGRTFLQRMQVRMEGGNRERSWGLGSPEIDRVLGLAVTFANEDVKDFGLDDPGRFLSNTWKLLPELNDSLRSQGQYTINEYRVALQKMEGFFASLVPQNVFHSWAQVPQPRELEVKVANAAKNKAIGVEYLQAKALAMALLEALADVSGGDCPLSLFTGDKTNFPGYGQQLEDFLPLPKEEKKNNPVVATLLQVGRLEESDFDLKNSPLAGFLYMQMTGEEFAQAVASSKAYFKRQSKAEEFLVNFRPDLRIAVAQAVVHLAKTRASALAKWVR